MKESHNSTTINVGGSNVCASKSARNIGAIMDTKLTMVEHINTICKSSYAQLRAISQIRKFITKDAAATLIHTFVTSRLDNLNSLLIGLPNYLITKLQFVQNHAAKIVMKKKKFDHVTPLLKELHWLPIVYRIQFKILLLTFKCLHGKAPMYLSSLLQRYSPKRALRSTNKHLLVNKSAKGKTYGNRAFSVAAPKLWNNLPSDLRRCTKLATFKNKLKTVLFRRAFDQ
jgi:hypothetical protein